MIDKRYAFEQIKRLKSVDKWIDHADNKQVFDELVLALMAADSEAIAFGVIDELVHYAEKLPPAPALRAMVYQENQKIAQTREPTRCAKCNGMRFSIEYFLVTYHGNSMTTEKREHLPQIKNEEQRFNFEAQIAANPGTKRQVVMSGARPCAWCNSGAGREDAA